MAATEFAGRGEGGPETDALVCYIKEATLYESESSGEPMKDIREVTLSAFSTQKDHSACTIKARLEELQIRGRKPLCIVLGEPKLVNGNNGTGTYKKYIKELMAGYMHIFLICILLLYRANV